MSTQVLAVLISGLVSLVVAGGGGFLTWTQIRRERYKWQVDVKLALTLELNKARMAAYPEIFQVLGKLSHGPGGARTAEMAEEVAGEINGWFYSSGGMCADSNTRGALLGLRLCCQEWVKTGKKPKETEDFRVLAIYLLRRDLDVGGLEEYSFENPATMLDRLKADLGEIGRHDRARGQPKQPFRLYHSSKRPVAGKDLLSKDYQS
jgi:hypothetical protein